MESRLEAYRAKKRKALEEKEKTDRYWNLLTFAPLRQRVFGNADNQLGEENVSILIIFLNNISVQLFKNLSNLSRNMFCDLYTNSIIM